MIRFIIIIISISSFIYGCIILFIGNVKSKKLLKLLPKEKIDTFRIGTGYNNIKIYRYIMSENISDTQEIIKAKRLIRPIIKKLFICISIFFICLMILFLIDIF
jgi:hypothetical protein